MGKWVNLPAATTETKGIVSVGNGINNPSPGVIQLVQLTGQLCVDPNGNDTTGDGSQTNPFLTLTKAFAFIVANPLEGGYLITLPPFDWEEAIGLPPAGVTLVGTQSTLSGPAGATLTWSEGENSGQRTFVNLNLLANITGANGGDLVLDFTNCSVVGTVTLVGTSTWVNCGSLPTFVNCQTLSILGFSSSTFTPQDLALSFDPIDGGENGDSTPGILIQGGRWNTISYTATDNSAPLVLQGCEVVSVQAANSAIVRCRDSRVLTSLTASNTTSVIEYDQSQVSQTPSVNGFGSFILAEYLITRTIGILNSPETLVVPIPKLVSGAPAPNLLTASNLPGCSVNYVSNTNSTLTVLVTPPSFPSPSFQITLLLRP